MQWFTKKRYFTPIEAHVKIQTGFQPFFGSSSVAMVDAMVDALVVQPRQAEIVRPGNATVQYPCRSRRL